MLGTKATIFRYLVDSQPWMRMEATVNLEQLITEGIKGLPPQYLSEVADFVVFVRRRAMEQQPYDVESTR